MRDTAIYNIYQSVVSINNGIEAFDANGNLVTLDENLIEAEIIRLQAEQVKNNKWDEFSTFLFTLTVQRPATATEPIGFKFSADPQSIANISLEIDTMLDTDTRTWYEDWGSATVTKQELQEAKRLASEAKQAKLTELFGV